MLGYQTKPRVHPENLGRKGRSGNRSDGSAAPFAVDQDDLKLCLGSA